MQRRHFLAGAVTAAAGCAAVVAGGLALRTTAPPAPGGSGRSGPSGRPGPARGRQIQVSGELDSRYTGSRMGWTISLPGGSRPPQAIVFCLHAMGGNHRMAFDSIRIPEVAARLGLRVAVAAVDGGPDSYWHRRADGSDSLAMFLREFVPLVRARAGRLPQAVMGWSMGGYGALLAAERAAGMFRAVSPASPALWLAPGLTAPGAFDSPADFYANDVFTGVGRLRGLDVAVFCGTADPFYLATRHLVSLMRYPHLAKFGPGGHDPEYWRAVAPAQLRAIAAAPGIAR